MSEVALGCPESAWILALTAGHPASRTQTGAPLRQRWIQVKGNWNYWYLDDWDVALGETWAHFPQRRYLDRKRQKSDMATTRPGGLLLRFSARQHHFPVTGLSRRNI